MNPTSEQEIVVCPDGPLLVRGDFDIVSTTGEDIPRRRKTVALCRCGASGIKPFCDGTHKLIGFKTGPPAPTEAKEPAESSEEPSEAAGAAG